MKTQNLQLPYIASGQSQKHVTYNDAMTHVDTLVHLSVITHDTTEPVMSPQNGDCYLIPDTPSGDWVNHANQIATWVNDAWIYHTPLEGWTLWNKAASRHFVYVNGQWEDMLPPSPTNFDNLSSLGVNASADTQNRLSVSSASTLLTHDGTDHRLTLNKNQTTDTSSLVLQTGYSGRAEIGLLGDDNLHLKTSTDGTSWLTHLLAEAGSPGIITDSIKSGRVTIPIDQAVTIPAYSNGGIVAITLTSSVGYPQPTHSGLFVYDTGPSLNLLTLVALTGIENAGEIPLTGTTGTLGKTSIAVQSGELHIENRNGIEREYSYVFLC